MIYTGPKASALKTGFLSSALKCSRKTTGIGQVEIVWVQGYAQDLDISDLSYFAFPSGNNGKWNKSFYSTQDGTSIDASSSGEGGKCRINGDGSISFTSENVFIGWTTWWDPIPPSELEWTTDPWNPRAVRVHGEHINHVAENWKVRIHGPVTGALAQYQAMDIDTFYGAEAYDYAGFEDDKMITDVVATTVTDVTIDAGEYFDFTVTDAPPAGYSGIAIFYVNHTSAEW